MSVFINPLSIFKPSNIYVRNTREGTLQNFSIAANVYCMVAHLLSN